MARIGRKEMPQDSSMLEEMGLGPSYPDATAENYEQTQPVGELAFHIGTQGPGIYDAVGRFVRPLTPEEAMHMTNFQPTEVPQQTNVPDGFTVTQDLPSRGRISARVSVDFDAHGNPALLPDARELGVAMLASAGTLAQQGGMQVRYEGYDGGQQYAPNDSQHAADPYYPASPVAPPQPEYPYGGEWSGDTQNDGQFADGTPEDEYQEPLSKRELKQLERARKENDKAVAEQGKLQAKADKTSAREAKKSQKSQTLSAKIGRFLIKGTAESLVVIAVAVPAAHTVVHTVGSKIPFFPIDKNDSMALSSDMGHNLALPFRGVKEFGGMVITIAGKIL